jgi:O-antigen ligase
MIVQWITGLTFQVAGIQALIIYGGRVAGTLGFTGPAAGYISVLVLIAISMLWGFPRKSGKILAGASIGLGIVAMVSTGSRIGWISFAATTLVFILAGLRIGWIKRETLVLVFIAVIAIVAIFYGPIFTRFTANDFGSAGSRPMMWKLAWNIIRAHPWLGVGAGNYALVTPNFFTPDVGDPAQVLNIQVHNSYLDVWAESGIFALLCYLALFGTAIIKAWSCISSPSRFKSMMGLGLGLAIVSLCIQMFTDTFHVRSITLFAWSLVALAASLPRLELTHRSPVAMSED